jgi:hypothetical protein
MKMRLVATLAGLAQAKVCELRRGGRDSLLLAKELNTNYAIVMALRQRQGLDRHVVTRSTPRQSVQAGCFI